MTDSDWPARPDPETLHPCLVTTGPESAPHATTIFGLAASKPVIGEPVTLYDARHVWRWDGGEGGLFGLAIHGGGGALSPTVPEVTVTCQSYIAMTQEAWETVRSRP
jgi:hypothetical protein